MYLVGLCDEERDREALRLGKRLLWLAHQVEEYPVPVEYLIRSYLAFVFEFDLTFHL